MAGDTAGAVAHGPCRAADRHRGARHRMNVAADPKRVAHTLSTKLGRELRQLDREIAVRFMVLHHHNARQYPLRVQPHEDLDRAVVTALEWLELRGPEREPGDGASGIVCLEVWRFTTLGRKRRGCRKQLCQLPTQFRVEGALAGRRGADHHRDKQGHNCGYSHAHG